MKRHGALFVLACLALVGSAAADYTVQGKFLYRDRVFDAGGMTPATVDRPIRLADVQVLDDISSAVLGTGATDQNGEFTISVVDNATRNLRVRVMTKADYTPAFKARVLRNSSGFPVFALATPTYTAHLPTVSIDFRNDPIVAAHAVFSCPTGGSTIAEAFNIFDQALDAFDFVATLQGGNRPTRLLTLYWAPCSEDGTYYQHGDASIHLFGMQDDSDGWDDTVILHEIGHYVEANLADTDNPGGGHTLGGYYDPRLTWSEGWSTFFNNMVRDWKGIQRPDLYVDTFGEPAGPNYLSYSVEDPVYGQLGADNEVTVNVLLWDIVDKPSTLDTSPGNDDDPIAYPAAAADFWEVFTQYVRFASSITLEDFWDGWFARSKGRQAEMQQIFGDRLCEYFPDTHEADGSTLLAKTVVAGSPTTHHSIYPAGDQDWAVIGVAGGSNYSFETLNLRSWADTRLELYDQNVALLATNDDRVLGDKSSRIDYTPPAAGLVYLKCVRKTDQHTYGSYDLRVSGTPVPVALADVHLETAATGIRLRWRAEATGGFAHFELERGDSPAGPFSVLARVERVRMEGTASLYDYLDESVQPGATYSYRIVGVEIDGARESFGPFTAASPPARFALHPPRPNPFNPQTTIAFELGTASRPELRVYDASGRLVRTLLRARLLPAGRHTASWDGRDDAGRGVASGVYLLQLQSTEGRTTRRAVLVR